MTAPEHKIPLPGVYDICSVGRPFLAHHYYTLSLSNPCAGVDNKILKNPPFFTLFTLKLSILQFYKLTISCLLTLQIVHNV